ncbi:hypothetical protein [Streptomyces sp. CT34]|uniref:hypothetical protein n=1 Tax=Streptomyces sp. CT34 TaxID=1553907 RepID=UPI00068D0A62|nr:hypothetical protein [Streptomyces sp. CT34]
MNPTSDAVHHDSAASSQEEYPGASIHWPRLFLVLLRATALLFAAGVLLQAILAGDFVTGNVELLQIHNATAQVLGVVCLIEIVVAFGVWRSRLTSAWPAVTTVLLLVLTGLQMALGHDRNLLYHIPLGTAIFGCAIVFAVWTFRVRTGRSGEVGQ